MPYITQAKEVFTILILCIGLASCHGDNLESPTNLEAPTNKKSDVWKIKEPKIRTQEGQAIPFSQFNENPPPLEITAQMIFPDPPDETQIEIESLCFQDNESFSHTWVREISKPVLPIKELIPIEVYRQIDLPIDKEEFLMHCQIKFLAQNQEGSKHFFELKNVLPHGLTRIPPTPPSPRPPHPLKRTAPFGPGTTLYR